MTFVVLLRGINVGGIRISMAALRSSLEDAGYTAVRTVLASGNVVLTATTQDPAVVRSDVEGVLRQAFGYEAWVVVVTVEQLAEIVAAFPWETDEAVRHPYVIFSTDGVSTTDLAAIGETADPAVERSTLGPHHVLFWEVVRGDTLSSVVGKASARASYKSTTTTRNLRTLRKILA
ncbi:DUF1697 domain-containing protein [Rhodococcus sp. BP-149]|uniref:DUF1697 domain-containing protein n=1 Tax=unclassified Rhodococcus (in: high G+C Gram-positive bacteria) TaxID=192944 RepID=UPI0006F2BEDF|nr:MULTISPECIES: DUF1697 domain-containing protein [unclassified Rhodococcus (in: high G+C Gram-positive bacteria)]KQU30508.1 hypothetical protein ASG69_05660 [Rhodococcus sp. Leaf225]KQU44589.1 hypothetical protein ASH03_11480 [Rhodococcus sp. Leaf258]MBY6686466.1 DUF1697 domain-containing protein [Rhodococcus sp. BP-288]MBY6693445.1 DUF1697 domain-containing protein [Rhodococcus sp. BP-188]MBY6699958.1 DUF1697 domain-containing protein [Rhodococcus sp. BP-285]